MGRQGRTVSVTKNLGDSLRILDGILARNKVKSELWSTERHEKKGLNAEGLQVSVGETILRTKCVLIICPSSQPNAS